MEPATAFSRWLPPRFRLGRICCIGGRVDRGCRELGAGSRRRCGRVPGRAAYEAEQLRARDGVPVRDEELEQLLTVARRRGLDELADRAAAGRL